MSIYAIRNTMMAWNTNRPYTDKGQRIAAITLSDGRLFFFDIDRNVRGVTETATWGCREHNIEFVMTCYDHGIYESVHSLMWHFSDLTTLLGDLYKFARDYNN